MEAITERFINVYKHLIDSNKISTAKEFANNIGISPQLLTEITKGRNEVGLKAIQNTLLTYRFIDPSWLLNGYGAMIINYAPALTSNKNEQAVPFYDHVASAGKVQLFKDFTLSHANGFISVPNMPRCDGAVPIVGDSMYPLLKSGDIVCYKLKEPTNIIYGEMYLIDWHDGDGDDYLMAKFIAKSSQKDHIRLVSHNKHHDELDIPLKSIRQLALIKLSIRFNTH